jgi:uncharacterized protein YxeA
MARNKTIILQEGDVFKADKNWYVAKKPSNDKTADVAQSFNVMGRALNAYPYTSIELSGKKFVVTHTETHAKKNKDVAPYIADGHHVTAQELLKNNEIKKGGLTIAFYQTGFCNGMNMAYWPNVVGHMKKIFVPKK